MTNQQTNRDASKQRQAARKGYQNRNGRGGRGGVSPARQAALEAVRITRERDAFAQDVIDKHIDTARMSPEDRAFATKLVLGVVSTVGTLDDVLNRCMRSPSDVDAKVRDALRVSAYEIIFLAKSPYAAVDQGVELVRSIAPRAGGVANAVLRKVVEAKDAFPFGDPKTDVAAFARKHAFPLWLTRKIVQDFGVGYAENFMEVSNEPAPVCVAVNAAKISDEEAVGIVEAAHGNPSPVQAAGFEVPGCFGIDSGQVLLDGRIRRLIANGCLLVSDAASQAVARLILPESKPASLLEIGAGRGTKTILLQSNALRLWNGQIDDYVTLDNHEFKTDLLVSRASDYGINVTQALTGDATKASEVLGNRTFDVVFIDAPCTGLGTLRRHPEIRWRLRPSVIAEHAELGLAMLKSASAHVAPGGTLAYATCTITPEENVEVVKSFLASEEGSEFRLVPIAGRAAFATTLESGGSDAHFAVKMVKLSK